MPQNYLDFSPHIDGANKRNEVIMSVNNPITKAQHTYLLNLLEDLEVDKYEDIRQQLKIPDEVPIEQLSKDEAYKLISKMVAVSSPQTVEKALSAAVKKRKAGEEEVEEDDDPDQVN
jgi:hypothetical protein